MIAFNFAILSVGLALAAVVAAQEPAPPAPADCDVVGRCHGIVVDDGVVRGIGPGYKAAFDRGGMEYTPALGELAPHNLPLRFTLESIRRGDAVIHHAGDHPAARPEGDRVVCYHRTAHITERYLLRPDGVELTFTFARALPGIGDLVVRGRIETPLDLESPAAAQDGLRFLRQGIGGVRVGGVTGIDALGRRARGSLRVLGDHLELVLPGSFVDAAAHPMVLDPLLGTEFLVGTGSSGDSDPDAAFDATNQVYLVAFRRSFSATDSDIYAQRVLRSGALFGAPIAVALAGSNLKPSVANVGTSDRFLVVWQTGPTVFGPWDILGRAVDAATGTATGFVFIAGNAGNEIDPDTASENATDNDVLVVWHEEFVGIRGQTIDLPAGTGGPTRVGTPTLIAASPQAREPAISRSHSSSLPYVVVWAQAQASNVNSIMARAVDRDMNLLGTGALTVFSNSPRSCFPDVDGDGTNFMVVFQTEESMGSPYHNVLCNMVRWNGSNLVASTAVTGVAVNGGVDERDPAVGFVGPKYVVLWAAAPSIASFAYQIRGIELGANCRPCGNPLTLTGLNSPATRDHEGLPEVATSRAAGGASTDALLVFTEGDSGPPFASEVIAQRFVALGGGAVVNLSPGCGNGGAASFRGGFVVGNTTFQLLLAGATPGSLAVRLMSFGGTPQVCGPCVITPWVEALFTGLVAPNGSIASTFALPCSFMPYAGATMEFQWLTLGSGSNPCPLYAGLAFSNRLQATLSL